MLQDIYNAIVGKWEPSMVKVVAEKLVLCSGDYHTEDVVSEATSGAIPWHFPNAAKKNGGGGYITTAIVTAEATGISSWLSLYLFTATPTSELNDDVKNTAPIFADRFIYVGVIDFPACSGLGTNEMDGSIASPSTVGNLPMGFVCEPSSRDLYGIMVVRNIVDLTDKSALTVSLIIEQV